jgi:predicted DNA-binding antitoxin AbrB/MazE fold protein
MIQILDAIFDGTVLRPEEPIELRPNTRVRITIESVEPTEIQPLSFLQTARALNLQGPPDWSEKLEDYLYERDDDANG